MRTYILAIFLFFPLLAAAEPCNIPEFGDEIPGAREYSRTHEAWDMVSGKGFVSDSLWIWPSQSGNQCFLFFAMFSNSHYCRLGGEAIQTKGGAYEFKDKTCAVRLRIADRKVRAVVRATRPDALDDKNNSCVPEDKWGCGDKTRIETHSYRFSRANPAVQGTLRDEAAQRP
jgi:hypothetical protein